MAAACAEPAETAEMSFPTVISNGVTLFALMLAATPNLAGVQLAAQCPHNPSDGFSVGPEPWKIALQPRSPTCSSE